MSSRASRLPDLPINFGKYVLRERIGKGGMAEIFRATAQGASGFQKELVIKRMLPSLTDDPGFADVIVREAKIAVTLRHQNIVQVFELGEVDGRYFIAMEYIHGRDLRHVLARCGETGKQIPIGLAVHIAMEVCKALDYTHDVKDANGKPLDLVHRDISPTNLMASFAGEIKVLDFGIAKAEVSEYVTREGLIKGNCPYMSPEQIAGQAVNHQSDLFSLGSTLYELLTGKRAFEAPSQIAIMQRIYAEPPIRPREHRPEIPEDLEKVVLKLLEKEREKRCQDAAEAHHALADLIGKQVPAASTFDLTKFLAELYGDDSLRESRSLPPEGHTSEQAPLLPPHAGVEDTQPDFGKKDPGATTPLRVRISTPGPGLPSVGGAGQAPRARVTTRPMGEQVAAPATTPPVGHTGHTRRMANRVVQPAIAEPPIESKRIWALPALMLAALVAYLLWPAGDLTPRYRPRPDRVDRTNGQAPDRRSPTPPPTPPVVAKAPVVEPHPPTPPTPPNPPNPDSDTEPATSPNHGNKRPHPPAATGKLRLSSDPWANVTIDGRRITKPTPLVDYPIPAGARVITLSHPGYKTQRRIVRITAGETSLLRVVLERVD